MLLSFGSASGPEHQCCHGKHNFFQATEKEGLECCLTIVKLDIRRRLIKQFGQKDKENAVSSLWGTFQFRSFSFIASTVQQITLIAFRHCVFNGYFICCHFLFVFIVEITSFENISDVRDIWLDLQHWFLETQGENSTMRKVSIQRRIFFYHF